MLLNSPRPPKELNCPIVWRLASGDMALTRSVGGSARTCMYIALQALYRVGALFLSNDKLPVMCVHYSFCQPGTKRSRCSLILSCSEDASARNDTHHKYEPCFSVHYFLTYYLAKLILSSMEECWQYNLVLILLHLKRNNLLAISPCIIWCESWCISDI